MLQPVLLPSSKEVREEEEGKKNTQNSWIVLDVCFVLETNFFFIFVHHRLTSQIANNCSTLTHNFAHRTELHFQRISFEY